MAGTSSKTIRSLSAEILRRFGPQLDGLALLRARWQVLVGEPMGAHSEPTLYDGGRLTVTVTSPAWAGRLRQQQGALIRALRAEPALRALRELNVRIQPTRATAAPNVAPPQRPSRLSPTAARLVRSVAASVTDPELRAALERLGDLKK